MLKKILLTVIISLVAVAAYARPLTLNEISESVCRISSSGLRGNSYGSGICISETNESYIILTNAHVVGRNQTVNTEFFKRGHKTQPLQATVLQRWFQNNTTVDFALCAVPKAYFGQYPPRVIPLVPKGYTVKAGYYIASMGCPQGMWAHGWEGHVLQGEERGKILFLPDVIEGQSGSGVLVLVQGPDGEWHTRVGAVVTWRIEGLLQSAPQRAVGGAVPVSMLYSLIDGTAQITRVPVSFKPASQLVPVEKPCKRCGKLPSEHALGSDGQLYCIKKDSNGNEYTTSPLGVTINWGWRRNPQNPCPPEGCPQPDYGNPGPNIIPRPNQPQVPQLPNSPYGQLPDIGAPWPGIQPQEPELPKPTLPIPTPETTKEPPADPRPVPVPKVPAPKKVAQTDSESGGILGWIRGKARDVGIGVAITAIFFVLLNVWKKRKPQIVAKVDSIQGAIEAKVASLWGPEAAKDVRDVLENLESSLLGVIEYILNNKQLAVEAVKAKNKGKLDNILTDLAGVAKRTEEENKVLAAMHQTLSEEEVKKVKTVLDTMNTKK